MSRRTPIKYKRLSHHHLLQLRKKRSLHWNSSQAQFGGTATRSETESVVDDIEQAARSYKLHLFEALPVYIFLVGAGVDLNKLGITTTDIQVLKSLTSKPTTDHLKTQIQKYVMHKKDELVSAERALNEAHKTGSFWTCFFIMYRPSNCSYVDHFCCLAD